MFTIAGGIILAFFGLLLIGAILAAIGACFNGVAMLLDKIPSPPPIATHSRTWLEDTRDIHNIR